MPSPSETVAVASMLENGGNLQSNTLELIGNIERNYQESTNKTDAKEETVLRDDEMALVMMDESNLQIEKYQEGEKVVDRSVKDGLSLLIDDWSAASKTLWRRGSCEFTTCVSPCIKKATSHLQQLQEQLAKINFSQEESSEFPVESRSTEVTYTSGEVSPTLHSDVRSLVSEQAIEPLSFVSSASSEKPSFFSRIQESSGSVSKPSLTQVHLSQTRSLASRSSSLSSGKTTSLAHKMGYGVVDEVIRLLGRLERDRLSTQQMLIQEKQKVNQLKSEIDRLAFKRLLELPTAVQQEHESCTTDINELKWHCAYRGRLEARIKRRVDYAETQHAKFIDDVESAKRSCPLVREKLDLEALSIASIQSKQDETDEELRQTLGRLDATQRKTNEAQKRATEERKLIKQDVDIIRNLLNEVSDELARLKMNYTSNVHTISDIKNTLKENAQQCHNLEKREERVKTQEAAAEDKVVKLREKIAEQGAEHVRLSEENEKLRKENVATERDYQSEISKIKIEITQCGAQVREMTRTNKANREELDSMGKHIEKCKKQKKSDKKALVRTAQEIDKVKQQIEMIGEDTKKVMILNHSLKTTKAREEEEYLDEEDSLRNTEQSLKSQLKEEAHMRTVLQARIAADTSDLLRSRVDSKKKKEKVSQQAVDAEIVLKRIREQVSRLENAHKDREQAISQIDAVLDKLAKQRDEMESKYRARIAELRPKQEISKKEKLELEQQIDQITWKSDMMTKKMEDMSSSTIMMTRVIASTEEDIGELEKDNEEGKLRLEANIETEDSLRQLLDESEERCRCRRDEHETHIENRKEVLEQNLKLLQENLADNKKLAEEYQKNYSRFIQVKEEFFKDYESLVNEECHLKDHKELHTLQRRMRECLQHYYRLRGLRNKSQVAQFQVHSQENNDKLFELKQELSNVITHINNFLESNNAAHKTISMEAAAMAQTPVR